MHLPRRCRRSRRSRPSAKRRTPRSGGRPSRLWTAMCGVDNGFDTWRPYDHHVVSRTHGSSRTAAFFDLDKTIIAKSSVLAFGRPFYQGGLLSRRAIVKSMYAQIVYMLVGADESKMEEVREAMLSLTKGWQQDNVAQIVAETL